MSLPCTPRFTPRFLSHLLGRGWASRASRASRTAWAAAALLSGCQSAPPPNPARQAIDAELQAAISARPAAKVPDRVSNALLPPMVHELPRPTAVPEQRFDLCVSNATVAQVFQAIASGSRYSILIPPGLTGIAAIDLKDVTVREALDAMRELYGYEYRVDGTRIYIQPASLQTRIFQVSYPTNRRVGRSDTRVSAGSLSASPGAASAGNVTGGGATSTVTEGSQVSTTTDSDFWKELETSLKAVVGTDNGRQIVISQHTGVIVVKGFPKDLREVEDYLRSARLSIDRQVMLEAKIVEVSLNEGAETGINWALLSQGNHRLSMGADTSRINVPGSIGREAGVQSGSIVTSVDASTTPATVVSSTLSQLLASPVASGGSGLLGLAFTTNTFNGLLSFLETQGTVHVLSSPRVAAVNNEKAVLRVGTDDFFITNISTTTTASASGSVTTPSITVQPFFSGISLDVTPQIDEDGMVTMHVRPSVSEVSERNRVVNLGTLGTFRLPLASSNVNETDTIVRVQDGAIVAIGGLMQQSQSGEKSQVPGVGDLPVAGHLFKRTNRNYAKRELVFLIKPTVIKSDAQWRNDLANAQTRINGIDATSRSTLRD
jgi:MSHA biogenesis protein MshL